MKNEDDMKDEEDDLKIVFQILSVHLDKSLRVLSVIMR